MLLIAPHILISQIGTLVTPLPTMDGPLDANMTEQVYKRTFHISMEDTGAVEGGDIYRYLSIPETPSLAIFNRKDKKKSLADTFIQDSRNIYHII